MRRAAALAATLLALAGCAPAGTRPATQPPSGYVSPTPTAAVTPACSPGGTMVQTGAGDAAMGLRVLGFVLTNCGDAPLEPTGYPDVRLLGEDREPVDVRVLHGAREVSAAVPALDAAPRPVTVQPGECAEVGVVWHNTYDDIREPPVEVHFVEFRDQEQTVAPPDRLDLGSTGKLGIGPWEAVEPGTCATKIAPAPDPSGLQLK